MSRDTALGEPFVSQLSTMISVLVRKDCRKWINGVG